MFIVARAKADRIREVQAYLYQGQRVITDPVLNEFGSAMVIVESAHGFAGKMLIDRLSSGLMGAKPFQTRKEAEEYIRKEM